MRYITVNTKLIALLGTPLGQSVSYLTQNRVYEELGLDYFYFPVELPRAEQLEDVVNGFRQMNVAGFGVTKPYKETIIPYLEQLDHTAETMGACNTVVVRDGQLIGYNTDGIGCLRSLKEERGFAPKGKAVFSYGAGGAARAVLFQLAAQGAGHLTVAALDGMAQRLAEDINRLYPGLCTGLDMGEREELALGTGKADLVMNLTGLGMAPHLDETPMDPAWLHPGQLCYDAIYNPVQTRFLKDAEAVGCQTLNGLGMVIFQGLEQIKLWTGVDAPADIMYRALEEIK
jgi:shikimate dehydrogenase